MVEANQRIQLKHLIQRVIRWITYLGSKWKYFTASCLVGISLGIFASSFSTPVYTALISFSLDEEKAGGSLAGYLGVASQLGIDLGSSGNSVFIGENIIELLKSRLVIEKTLLDSATINNDTKTFADHFVEKFNWKKNWRDKGLENLTFINYDRNKPSRVHDSLLFLIYKSIVKNNISIQKLDKKLSIYNLIFKSTNEEFSKKFSETVIDEVSRFYIETRTKKSRSMVNILQHKADSVRYAYETSLYTGASFNDANRNLSRQVASTTGMKKQVEIQMLATYYAELVKHLETAKISLSKETPLIQKIDTPVLPLDKQKLGKVKASVYGVLIMFVFTSFFFIVKIILYEDHEN